MDVCEYRLQNKNGRKCGKKYCKVHIDKSSEIHKVATIIELGTEFDWGLTVNYVNCFKNAKIDVNSFEELIYHIVPIVDLVKFYGKNRTKTKKELVTLVVKKFIRLWELSTLKPFINSVIKLQRLFRKQLIGSKLTLPPENDTDPFTLDNICDIPDSRLFSYRDSKKRVWAFSAPHFFEWIKNEKKDINPYTREQITGFNLKRLNNIVLKLPPEVFKAEFMTPSMAFADALYEFDRIGFYTSINWFLKLTKEGVIGVYFMFNDINKVPTESFNILNCSFMNNLETKTVEELQLFLANEMKTMLINARERQFGLACALLVALTHFSKQAKKEMPSWVYLGTV